MTKDREGLTHNRGARYESVICRPTLESNWTTRVVRETVRSFVEERANTVRTRFSLTFFLWEYVAEASPTPQQSDARTSLSHEVLRREPAPLRIAACVGSSALLPTRQRLQTPAWSVPRVRRPSRCLQSSMRRPKWRAAARALLISASDPASVGAQRQV